MIGGAIGVFVWIWGVCLFLGCHWSYLLGLAFFDIVMGRSLRPLVSIRYCVGMFCVPILVFDSYDVFVCRC